MTVSIGPVELGQFEIPPEIHYGGTQRIATHYLADGRRSYDILGPEEFNIRFAGILSGDHAVARSRELDTIRRQGQKVVLTWGGFAIPVVLSQLMLEYHKDTWIHYSVSCFVVDDSLPVATDLSTPIAPLDSAQLDAMGRIDSLDIGTLKALADEAMGRILAYPPRPLSVDLDARMAATERALSTAVADFERRITHGDGTSREGPGIARLATQMRDLAYLVQARSTLRSMHMILRAGDLR